MAGHGFPVSASEITRVLGGGVRLPSRYADPELIARGGMSEVYRAADTVLGRPVAIKVLHEQYADDGEFLQRFSREARAAGRLSGEPHTVTIYDVGAWDGRPTIVMELLEGGSLDDVLRATGAQPPERALRWLDHAAAALDHAHAHGVVHRDVKPANLLLDGDSTLHVADFGIATAHGSVSLTRTGTVLGTVGYLAPEQAEGKPASPASDRYALAVVAYELLTGTRPFARDSAMAEAAAHIDEPVPSATTSAAGASLRRYFRARTRTGKGSGRAVRKLPRVRRRASLRVFSHRSDARCRSARRGPEKVAPHCCSGRRRGDRRSGRSVRRGAGPRSQREERKGGATAADACGCTDDRGKSARGKAARACTAEPVRPSGPRAHRSRRRGDPLRTMRRRSAATRPSTVARRRPDSDRRAAVGVHRSTRPSARSRARRARPRRAGRSRG